MKLNDIRLKLLVAATFVLVMLLFSFRTSMVSASSISITSTPKNSFYDLFPGGLACSGATIGDGPSWREIKIGHTTLQEFEKLYGETKPFFDMQRLSGEGYDIYLCVQNNIITSIKVGSELPYLNDYVAVYGKPDTVTYNQPETRVAFWFKKGIAIDIYINKSVDYLYGIVNYAIYFPYQEVDGYKVRWPYSQTVHEWISARDVNVSHEQNPFDFEAIGATITAESSRTPTPTFLFLLVTPTATP